jgi:hypothetical protein
VVPIDQLRGDGGDYVVEPASTKKPKPAQPKPLTPKPAFRIDIVYLMRHAVP